MKETTELGRFIKRRMEELGTNAYRVSKDAGVQPSTISHWVNGRRLPSPESCHILAEVLALDVDTLLHLSGHRPREVADLDPTRAEVHRVIDKLPEDELERVREYAAWRLAQSIA